MSHDGGVIKKAHEFPAHYKVLLDKLNKQRELDQFTDITLIVDGHQFRAHKAVLAACSQFFHKFFQDFTQEPLVEIEGVNNSAFCHLMEFIYTATLALSGQEEVMDVWRAAEYLQMQEAIKALNNRVKSVDCDITLSSEPQLFSDTPKSKKRKIAETSHVITETLPLAEPGQVEIEVEVGEEAIMQECMMEEEAMDGGRETEDSALAVLADITTKYQRGAANVKKGSGDLQEEAMMATKALEGIEVVEVQISDNLFRCEKCDRCFKLLYHLKQHMKTHMVSADKSFVCKHCGKTYAREGPLKQHINTYHYDAEELNRKLKKKVFRSKEFDHFGHIKQRLRKHTDEKPFECPDCHERFARNSTLKCHLSACQNSEGAKKGRKKLKTNVSDITWADHFAGHSSNFEGYVSSFDSLESLIRDFELANHAYFCIHRTKRNFNKQPEMKNFQGCIHWKDTQPNSNPPLICDGTPFIIMGTRTMECQHGPNRDKKRKEERSQVYGQNDISQIHTYTQKKRRHVQKTRKLGCSAKLYIRHIVKFPTYKSDLAVSDKKERERIAAGLLRDLTTMEEGVHYEHQFHVSLPESHSKHNLGEVIRLSAHL